jgi:PAS domain S-box-containing protein
LRISQHKTTGTEPVWVRYIFALTSCVLAVGLEIVFNSFGKTPITPFLPAFGAIIASGAWAGAGPGLFATLLLLIWTALDLSAQGAPAGSVFLGCMLFLIDGVLLTLGSARMWRLMKHASISEAWHRQLVETAAEGIWVHDDSGLITYSNARMAALLGVAFEGLPGRNVEEFLMPADLAMERIRTANLQSDGKVQFDRRLRRADGSELWVLACCNLVESAALPGGKRVSLAMMTDITERKRAENALRLSEERFRNLFESVLEGVYQSTPDGRIIAANPMLLRMLGLTNQADLNDVNITNDLYVDPRTRRRLLEQLEQEGGFQNIEYELRRRDGEIITVLENARVVRDDNGAVLYYEGTLTDITPRKQIEEQLRQAQQVDALGRMAGGVAHDFNNALTIITGFSQLALSELPGEHPARTSIEQALEASASALVLTRQLLSFSRRQSPSEGSVDLNLTITRVRQPAWRMSLHALPLPVYASQMQLELLTQALAGYVQRTVPVSGVELQTSPVTLDQQFCSRFPAVQPGAYAVLSLGVLSAAGSPVRDIRETIFDPTFLPMQPGDTAAMGLSTTQAIVAQCGGFVVRVSDSRIADGTICKTSGFHVFLPSAAALPGRVPIPPAGAAGETILLVEDEPLVRELSRDMLERQGYRVILASNAREAEQLSGSAGSFDLLITDTMMPTISGAELARRLRAEHPGLKVLYISGYAENEPGEGAGIDGAAFLQKPFSADSLGRKIRQMLSRS